MHNYVGSVDWVSLSQIRGWAANGADPSAEIELDVVVDDKVAGKVQANHPRHDANLRQYNDGKCGFVYEFAKPLEATADSTIEVRFANVGTVVPPGKFRIACSSDAVDADWQQRSVKKSSSSRHYVIHVGPPKTGTKYMQRSFQRLLKQSKFNDVLYPVKPWRPSPQFSHSQLAKDLASGKTVELEQALADIRLQSNQTILFSSEGFAGLPLPALKYFRNVLGEAEYTIVFYARRWSDWIPSQWQQSVKQGASGTLLEYYSRLLAHADKSPGINFGISLDRLIEVFGRENVSVVSYSNVVDAGCDLVEHFFRNFLNWSGPLPIQPGTVHESMGPALSELLRAINARLTSANRRLGYAAFEAYRRIAKRDDAMHDLTEIMSAMRASCTQVNISDNAFPMRMVYNSIQERYGDLLVGKKFGEYIFSPRDRQVEYITSDYLLNPEIAKAVSRICGIIVEESEDKGVAKDFAREVESVSA